MKPFHLKNGKNEFSKNKQSNTQILEQLKSDDLIL